MNAVEKQKGRRDISNNKKSEREEGKWEILSKKKKKRQRRTFYFRKAEGKGEKKKVISPKPSPTQLSKPY